MSQRRGQLARGVPAGIIKPLPNNFVERPWGGTRLRELKGLCSLPGQVEIGGAGLGESFEIAAFDDDDEARAHPSRIVLVDGSIATLSSLLEQHGETLLGERWMQVYGRRVPLLPKILDIRELLSVQGHPSGQTEVYVIIDAEPGATIRLGFRADMDRDALKSTLTRGHQAQRAVVASLRADASERQLDRLLAPWLAHREARASAVLPGLEALVTRGSAAAATNRLDELKRVYWLVLDAMNEIAVAPGQVIHNANPARVARRRRRVPTAEVHALGNPERKEIVALEIRKPGPTLRAWDNARFPLRAIDIDGALDVLNLEATAPEEFIVAPVPIRDRPHTSVSVDSEHFRLEHLTPPPGGRVDVVSETPHCLHNIGARVEIEQGSGSLGSLARGESALVPASIDRYRVIGRDRGAHVVKVSLP